MLVADTANKRIEEWVPPQTHDSQTIYYSVERNAEHPLCGEHPEWTNLPCLTKPAEQPHTSGLPELPVTTYTYNIWDEPEKSQRAQRSGHAHRDRQLRQRRAPQKQGNPVIDRTTLPKVSYEYSHETGALVKQSTGRGAEEKKITSVYNRLGQLTSYTDADNNTSTYEYENEKDGRLVEMNDGKGSQTYGYERNHR